MGTKCFGWHSDNNHDMSKKQKIETIHTHAYLEAANGDIYRRLENNSGGKGCR